MGPNSAWWSCFELRFRLLPRFSLMPFYAILQKDELSTLFLCMRSVSIFDTFSSHSRTVGLVGFFVFSSWISLLMFFYSASLGKKKKKCLGLHVYPSLSDCLILIKVVDHLSSNNLLLLTEAETSRHL